MGPQVYLTIKEKENMVGMGSMGGFEWRKR